MILFLLSVLFVIAFAYFTANILDSKNVIKNIIYFFLCAFANVVLTFELLSLFSFISVEGVLILNFLFAISAFAVWLGKKRPSVHADLKYAFCKYKTALMLDKTLLILSLSFIFMFGVSLWLVSFIPSVDAASNFYHVLRSLFWIENGNLNHFNIADSRVLVFPINSELLYTWVILFLKKDIFLGIFSLMGYVLYIISLFGISGKITVSLRKKLWVVLIVSSFTAVITYLTSTETNIIIAGLILAGMYLYICSFKRNNNVVIYMSSLAFALAAGVKTLALILFPAALIWFFTVGFYYKKSETFNVFVRFLLLFLINFLLFASYNYILNFINYGNFISSAPLIYAHKNLYGIKGFMFNLINYIFMMFQFPELEKFIHLSDGLFYLKKLLVKSLHLVPYTGVYSNDSSVSVIDGSRAGFGLLGLIMFVPCLIFSGIKLFLCKGKRDFLLNSFSILFLVSILVMAYLLVYMSFNIRFIVIPALISAPVLLYSYTKKLSIYKFTAALIAVIYFIYIPLNITNINVLNILNYIKNGYNVSMIRDIGYCSSYAYDIKTDSINSSCFIRNYIRNFDKRNKFLYFSQDGEGLLVIKLLQFEGYDIDYDLIETSNDTDFNKYNIVITLENRQTSTLLKNFEKLEYGLLRDNGIVCQYNSADGNMILTRENAKPFNSVCKFEKGYFFKKDFKIYDILKYNETIENISTDYHYYVYENVSNPVIK